MTIKVGVNGFGRIGRLVIRAGINNPHLQFVAVNDLTDAVTNAHLFKYDSTFGVYPGTVEAQGNAIIIDGKRLEVTAEKDPANLPWKRMGVDIVIESTGKYTEAEKAKAHITAGAKKVIISAPAKGEDLTICMGINDDKYDPAKHHILSNASCTTNCLAPIAKLINDNYKILAGSMTTIHAFTNDQKVLDFAHKDLRRARAASLSMIPSSTGAAKAIGLVIPELKGKLGGIAVRVPTPDVSLVDLAVVVANPPKDKDAVNALFKSAAASGKLKGYLRYLDLPLVSKDFTGDPSSSIFDSSLTDVKDNLIKAFGWYDNEWGYSMRVIDLAVLVASKLKVASNA
ncbi:MAG: type I glyceraldehyde-3-phosphate dehydrogenase [Elusimicrobiota bacterium]|jgi:glyceraldehyde 3-phosphate dehydrogenase